MKKRSVVLSFVLAGVLFAGYHLTHPECAEAQQGGCCGLSTQAAQSLKAMFSTGSFVAPSPLVTTAGTGSGLWEFSGQTNISGPDATTNVEIGSTANDANAGTGGTSVVIGNGAANASNGAGNTVVGSTASVNGTGVSSVVIGSAATTGSNNTQVVVVGANSTTAGSQSIVIGQGSNSGGIGSITIGNGANANGGSSIVMGNGANSSGASNVFIAGAPSAATNNVFFGKGNASVAATAYTFNGTAGSGTDNAGGGVNVAGGRGTGTARGGNVVLQASPSLTTGTTLQTLEDRQYIVAQRFALTDNTVATFSTLTLGDDTGGGGTISYCVISRDATTSSNECGEVDYGGVDVTAGAGGETCPTPTKQGTPLQILSGATLTVTFAATTGTDLCNLRVTADTNIATPTALYIVWNASNPGGRTLTPQ